MYMKNFITSLLSNNFSTTSSKRFAAILSLLFVLIFSLLATVHNKEFITPQFMFEGLLWYSAAALGLTAIEKVFKKEDSQNP